MVLKSSFPPQNSVCTRPGEFAQKIRFEIMIANTPRRKQLGMKLKKNDTTCRGLSMLFYVPCVNTRLKFISYLND